MTPEEFEKFLATNPSDAELDAVIASGRLPSTPEQKKTAKQNAARVVLATDPYKQAAAEMSPTERALAGVGAELSSILSGAADKARLAFLPKGKAGEDRLKAINARRAEEALGREVLYEHPEAIAGRFGAQMLPALFAPARLGAQAALSGGTEFLRGPGGPLSGLGSALAGSALDAGLSAGTTAVFGVPMFMAGKTAGAATGQRTAAGAKAMDLNRKAKDIGIDLRIADLDPTSAFGMMEARLPGAGRAVQKQAAQLAAATSASRNIPSKTGRSFETRTVGGDKLRSAVVDAADDLMKAGSARWTALDDYVVANKLRPVVPDQTFRKLEQVAQDLTPRTAKGVWQPNKNPVFQRIADENAEAAQWVKQIAGSSYQDVAKGVPFSSLNDIRVAIGKAYGKAQRDYARSSDKPVDLRAVRDELAELYGKLNDDVASWGTINAKHAEGKALFDDAVGFWRDRIVPDVINNPLVGKSKKGFAGRDPRGFQTPEEIYRTFGNNQALIERLRDGMTPENAAMLDVFAAAEDARRALATGALPQSGWSSVAGLLPVATGHPLAALGTMATHLPGSADLASRPMVKSLHFARDLTRGAPPSALPSLDLVPRAAWGAAQYPTTQAEDWERELLAMPPR